MATKKRKKDLSDDDVVPRGPRVIVYDREDLLNDIDRVCDMADEMVGAYPLTEVDGLRALVERVRLATKQIVEEGRP